jgi:hypothetical protein
MRTQLHRILAATALASLAVCAPALAQRAPRGGGPEARTAPASTKDGAIIQWYATLDRGLAEAKRTGRPILLVSDAPHCAGVSGMWCPGKVKIDNGWLLKDEIVAASRDFVCIRLTSYESAEEAAFVTKLQGNPVNTVFAVLTPDAQPAIAMKGLGRGPGELFSDPADMVRQMGEIAEKFPAKKADGEPALPITLDVRLGLAVASADLQPLALVVAPDAKERMAKSREQLKRLALAKGVFFETGIPVSGKKEAEDRTKFKAQVDAAKKSREAQTAAPSKPS